MKSWKNSLAFTLAEILITLGIIGVVASITIPVLMNNIQQAELKTSFKKAYSVASQAWEQVVTENPGTYIAKGGWSCTWPDGTTADYNNPDGRADAFKAKMHVAQSCINQDGCWASNYEIDTTNGLDGYGSPWTPKKFSWITTDGMCWGVPFKDLDEATILVDTNCNKNPNKIGQDIFSFLLGKDGVVYFAIDDKSSTGKPVSSGSVCPLYSNPTTFNDRTISFKSWLYN